MSPRLTTQLVTYAIVFLVLAFVMQRRMRPQPVRTNQILVRLALIVVVIGASLLPTGSHLLSDDLALALVPVFLVVGLLLGAALVRTMTFSTDENGQLWMQGGFLFAVILGATILLRLGVRAAASGGNFTSNAASVSSHGFLYDLSGDFLLLSLGLWAARGILIYIRATRPDLWARLPVLRSTR